MMICNELTKLLGISCQQLTEHVALVDTSFAFNDGESIPLFIEKIGPQVRLFDDGGTLLHFLGRGLTLDGKKVKFIKSIAEPNGVTLSPEGVLELWSQEGNVPTAFAKYISTIVGIIDWEGRHLGISTDISILIDEIGICLRAWKPDVNLVAEPEYFGISGQKFKLDYFFDDFAVIGVTPHHSSVGGALRKLIDIKSKPENSDLKILAVMDDRYDSENAKKESLVIEAIAHVWKMTKLQEQARFSARPN
jgi:hypothetical protein